MEHFWRSCGATECGDRHHNGGEGLPHIITSNVEHDSVKLVAEHLQKEGRAGRRPFPGTWCRWIRCFLSSFSRFASSVCLRHRVAVTDVTFVSVSKLTARVEVEDVVAAVRPNTCLVSIMLANNETGVIMVRKSGEALKCLGCLPLSFLQNSLHHCFH